MQFTGASILCYNGGGIVTTYPMGVLTVDLHFPSGDEGLEVMLLD